MRYFENNVARQVREVGERLAGPLSSIEYSKDAEQVVLSAHAFLELVSLLQAPVNSHEDHLECEYCDEYLDDEIRSQARSAADKHLARLIKDIEPTLRSFGAAILEHVDRPPDLEVAITFATTELKRSLQG